MPCYDGGRDDYNDSEVRTLRARCDLLARVACRALTELENNGIEDLLLLRDDETREFWAKHKEFDRKRKEAEAEKRRQARIKKAALAKLSDEEKAALGIDVLKSLSPAAFNKKKSMSAVAVKSAIIDDIQKIMKEAYDRDFKDLEK